MWDIILTILKFAGIGVGILIAILLVVLLLVLLVPVRYELDVENQEKLMAKGKVHWLFRIVTCQLGYENDELKQVVRIFGVPVWKK